MKKTLLLCCALYFSLSSFGQVANLKVGDTFELTEIKTMDGGSYSLDAVKDKVIVLNFWMIGCKGCVAEQPFLNELSQQYTDRDDIAFWSITLNREDQLTEYLSKHPIAWEIKGGVDFHGLTGDPTFQITCMPTTILIDKQRSIRYFSCGAIMAGESGQAFQALIDETLK